MVSPDKSAASLPQKENVPLQSIGAGFDPHKSSRLSKSQSQHHGSSFTSDGNRYQYRGPRGRPRYNYAPVTLTDEHLRNIASIRIKLSALPQNITTREIYDSLTLLGLHVGKVDILENDVGTRLGIANVHIEPPPSRWPPWNGPEHLCPITRRDSSSIVTTVQVLGTSPLDATMRTPLNFNIPRQKSFECRGLIFGMLASEDSMFKLPQYDYRDVRLDFQFFQLTVQLTFNVDLGARWGVKFYKIPIDFAHIKKVVRVKKKDGGCALVIQLPSAPKLFARATNMSASHDDSLSFWQERDSWHRQLEITHQPHRAKYAPAQLQKNRTTTDICRWTTYYLDIDTSVVESGMGELVSRLNDYNVNIGSLDGFDLVQPGKPVWKLLDSTESKTSLDLFHTTHLPFDVRYQLEACITLGLFNEYSITAEFLDQLLTDKLTGKPRDTDRARMMLEGVADQGVPYYNPMDIFDEPKVVHHWPAVKLPSQAAMIRRVVITPTGMYFKTPGVELTNRVLRKYSDLTDRFLRVQFTDELTFGKIWSCQGSPRSDELYTRVLRVLLNGIKVGDRHYKILAWSNSQFREHGAFFFCANDHVTCDDIREWMGNLKHIRSVGKFAARMGQCFTTTRQLSGISVPKIVGIEDIQRETDGHLWVFTDGVGKISPFFAQMIAHEQNMVDIPSCFQMRMGGCKGVLVVWPDIAANEVHIRPSQEKFKAPYNGLETIKVSTYSQATLNRQIIPILSCLGVEDRVFMELLEEELSEYDDAMTEPFKAATLLRQRIDENQISLVLADLVETFMDGQEPFLWTVLRLWKCWVLQRLKLKAAIGVKKSAFLFGCVDELGVLRGHSKRSEGGIAQDEDSLPQIFIQVPKEGCDPSNSNSYAVITGICLVGRNPSLHPGDLRVVQAVDVAELRHLRNVVVFPQKGDRDIPSMCSGGDLDGDDFFVLWDERLLPKQWNYPPMHHDADSSAANDLPHDISINDMCAFFAQHMKNDSVGLVATAHVAWADKLGPQSEKCIQLAKLHSMAVDYIKAGKPASMHKSLNAKVFPHFMERKAKSKNYRSHKPVGRIYDRVNVEKFAPIYDLPFDDRILKRYELTIEERFKAKEIKAKYDTGMRRLMGQHDFPVSEFEIWSTFVLSKPRVGTDYKLAEQIGRDVSALKDRFRIICGDTVRGVRQSPNIFSYSGIDLTQLDRFVAAMYMVTHDQVQGALAAREMPIFDEEGNKIAETQGDNFPMPLISFPWLFPKELARIANGGVPVTWRQKTKGPDDKLDEESGLESNTKIATLLHAKPSEGQKFFGKKDNASSDTDCVEGVVGGDYVRTASGQVIHRGEILQLFNDQAEGLEASEISHPRSNTPPSITEPTLTPDSPQSKNEKDDEEKSVDDDEIEIAGSDDEEDDEDLLEAMAKRLARHQREGDK
ncbi:hypothetical protein N0V93_009752 [Gnomoniopsis smithogilvyi]|uniref:RNA-dependent RNA polymerase n=1 Tax=Gnomoniopsis smithogilvyi TaxID=1191159 RepID=A0A9W8YK64_9PEZI|nr:hypothetical protein N0V93_009752 [Gnomoniopsis smithogilvyi]